MLKFLIIFPILLILAPSVFGLAVGIWPSEIKADTKLFKPTIISILVFNPSKTHNKFKISVECLNCILKVRGLKIVRKPKVEIWPTEFTLEDNSNQTVTVKIEPTYFWESTVETDAFKIKLPALVLSPLHFKLKCETETKFTELITTSFIEVRPSYPLPLFFFFLLILTFFILKYLAFG